MKPAVVVDVGNSRIKWGRCSNDCVSEGVSLPPEEPAAWDQQLDVWKLRGPLNWAVCGVHPARRDRFVGWIQERGHQALLLQRAQQLPLVVDLEFPDRVGIDRLMDAVAAKHRAPGTAAIIVDAGSAVTVDWLTETGVYGGGAIFPGLRLMVEALHNYTALLPRIEINKQSPIVPAKSTPEAMEAGILWAVIGGIKEIVARVELTKRFSCVRFVTGGDGEFLHAALGSAYTLWPTMTLEGIRITAEGHP